MSFLSPTLRLENLSTEPIMTQDHIPEDQRYNKQNIVAQWCVPINGKVLAYVNSSISQKPQLKIDGK